MTSLVPKVEDTDAYAYPFNTLLDLRPDPANGDASCSAVPVNVKREPDDIGERPQSVGESTVAGSIPNTLKREEGEEPTAPAFPTMQYLPTPSPAPDQHYDPQYHAKATEDQGVANPLTEEALMILSSDEEEANQPDSDADSLSSACSSLANEASLPTSFRTVLFDPADNETFSSSKRFLAMAQKRLYRCYGVNIMGTQSWYKGVQGRCAAPAKRQKSDSPPAPSTSTRQNPPRQPKTYRKKSKITELNLPVPHGPFSSVDAAYVAIAKINVPALGISISTFGKQAGKPDLCCNRYLKDISPATGGRCRWNYDEQPAPTKRQRLAPPPPPARRASSSSFAQVALYHSRHAEQPRRPLRTRVVTSSHQTALPPPTAPHSSTIPARPAPPIPPDSVAAFLASLNPPLASLALHLFDSGVQTLSSLAALSLLEPKVLEGFLEDIRATADEASTQMSGRGKEPAPSSSAGPALDFGLQPVDSTVAAAMPIDSTPVQPVDLPIQAVGTASSSQARPLQAVERTRSNDGGEAAGSTRAHSGWMIAENALKSADLPGWNMAADAAQCSSFGANSFGAGSSTPDPSVGSSIFKPQPHTAPSFATHAFSGRPDGINGGGITMELSESDDEDENPRLDTGRQDNSRGDILFGPSTTFRTSEAFFSSANIALQSSYGFRAQPQQQDSLTNVDNPYKLVPGNCTWVHSHPSIWVEEEGEDRDDEEDGSEVELLDQLRELQEGPRANAPVLRAPSPPRQHLVSTPQDTTKKKTNYKTVGWETSWTCKTKVPAMHKLVDERERVFQLHRELNDATLIARSQKMAAEYFETFSIANTIPANTHRAYARFCNSVNIPSFPISAASAALCMFTKCSHKDGQYTTFASELEKIRRVISPVWEAEAAYRRLQEGEGEAMSTLKDFIGERDGIVIRGAGKQKKPDVPPRKRKLPSLPVSSSEESYRGDATPEVEDVPRKRSKAEEVVQVVQVPCPGFPTTRHGFATLDDFYAAAVAAVVPVYGTGLHLAKKYAASTKVLTCNRGRNNHADECPFYLTVHQDANGTWRLGEGGRPNHSHGPDPRILRDPKWRPVIRSEVARKVLGMDVERRTKDKPLQTNPSLAPPPPPLNEDSSPASARLSPPPERPRPTAPPTLPSPSPHQLFTNSASSNLDISSFLLGLHPSLVSLAPHLTAAGLDSVSSLADLSLLEPSVLDTFLNRLGKNSQIMSQTTADAPAKPSMLQLKTFSSKIRGWAE
ncbi:hypothetical protein JCM11641_000678 [Rhodosporidiobolus odoratus]